MAVSIELKLSAKPGTFAKMYVEFGKVGIVPNVVSKESAGEDGSQKVVVEFDQDSADIFIVLEQLSHNDSLKVINVSGAKELDDERITPEVNEVFSDHQEEVSPTEQAEKIDIFDNHRGRRDKF